MKILCVVTLSLVSKMVFAAAEATWGSYPNRPLTLQDLIPPDGRRFSLVKEFDYLDQSGRVWKAPIRLVTDGASIPMPFWSVIGGPFEGLYREASIVHDAACCAQMQPWQHVHHMFYDAMRCSGVDWLKAKIMFYAVWAGGPRWTTLNGTMPSDCKVSSPVTVSVQNKLMRIIQDRPLTVEETNAVARPFFTRRQMDTKNAHDLVAKLKRRAVTPDERRVITLSVAQSKRFSETDVKDTESWIQRDDPALKIIEARAEAKRHAKVTDKNKQRGGQTAKPAIFGELPELLQE
jgi:hypothetical protein